MNLATLATLMDVVEDFVTAIEPVLRDESTDELEKRVAQLEEELESTKMQLVERNKDVAERNARISQLEAQLAEQKGVVTFFSEYLGQMMQLLTLGTDEMNQVEQKRRQAAADAAAAQEAHTKEVEAARSAHAHAIKALRAELDPPGTAVERAKHAARRLADMIRGLTGPGGPEDRSEVWGEVYNEVGKDGQRRYRQEAKHRFEVPSHDEVAVELAQLKRRVSDVELPGLVAALRKRLHEQAEGCDDGGADSGAADEADGMEIDPLSAAAPTQSGPKRTNRWVDPRTSLLPPFDAKKDHDLKLEYAHDLYGILESAVSSKHWVREDKRMEQYLRRDAGMRASFYYPHGSASYKDTKTGDVKEATKLTPPEVESKLDARRKKKLQNVLLLLDIIVLMNSDGQEVVSHLLLGIMLSLTAYGLSHHGQDLLSGASLAPSRWFVGNIQRTISDTYIKQFPSMLVEELKGSNGPGEEEMTALYGKLIDLNGRLEEATTDEERKTIQCELAEVSGGRAWERGGCSPLAALRSQPT